MQVTSTPILLEKSTSLTIGSASARLFQRQENFVPQIVGFAERVCERDVCHPARGGGGHGFELGDDVFETEGFSGGLGACGFEHYVDNVDVEV
ncbi:MAG: hypothetical protein Q9228_003169, partial [Teloschistes exilis]